jgi:probable HAF family extracellular repeat protein
MRDLGTLGGTVAQAVNGLNERGEVVGSTTLAGDLTHHAFLWDGKNPIDLGTLGGENAEADWVNDAEEVVGIAQYTVSCPNGLGGAHAFLWKNGVMKDLGTTDGLANSEAVFINSRAQVVGYSFTCDFSVIDAFLWEKGSIVDLNTLISPKSTLQLAIATYIDDRGEITALGVLPSGNVHAVLLTPCGEGDDGCEGENPAGVTQNSPAPAIQRPTTATPANPALSDEASGMLDRLRGRRFPGLRTLGPGTGPTN